MYEFRILIKDKSPKVVQSIGGHDVIVNEKVFQYRYSFFWISSKWRDFEIKREGEL